MTRVFLLVTLFISISMLSLGQCADPPTITLSSYSGSTCGTGIFTVSGSTFGGIAKNVTLETTGTGKLNPVMSSRQPFDFSYTPSAADIGQQVIITITTDSPKDPLCTAATASYVLTVNANPPAPLLGVITQPNCTISAGSAELSGLPLTGMWTITRTPGGITYTGTGNITTISDLATGNYTFKVTDALGCTSPSSAVAVIHSQPKIPTPPSVGVITQPSCTVSTGSVILNGLPQPGTWTLTRTPDGVITTGSGNKITISGLTEGTYTFIVTNADGCASNASANVVINPQPATPTAPFIVTVTSPTCALSTGSVQLNGLPASGVWTINSIPGGVRSTGSGDNTTIAGFASGSYTFTVTNAESCTSPPSASVTINPQPQTPNAPAIGAVTQPTCTVATGSVNLTGLPATGSWTLTRTPGDVITTGSGSNITVSDLVSGTYKFLVTNTEGCTSVASAGAVITSPPSGPAAPVTGTITQPTCNVSTGSAVLSGLPSTGTWMLIRTPGAVSTTGSGAIATITGLPEGTYSYTVTNSAGCISTSSGNIVITAQPSIPATPIVGTITIPTCSLSTGSVVLSGLPATGWTLTRYPGAVTSGGTGTTMVLTGIPAGLYNYTVTTVTGCVSALSANVSIPAQPVSPSPPLIGAITQPRSDLPTGSVVLNGLPSAGQWSLTLTPGNIAIPGTGTTKTISGLAPGSYSFTVTNSVGCTSGSSAGVIINTLTGAPLVVITNPAPVCFPSTVNITLPGITAGSSKNLTFTYWIDAAGTKAFGTPAAATSGTYYIKGTTTDGFSTIKQVIVTVYKAPIVSAGPDQVLAYLFETNLDAQLANNYESGVWSLVSGTGMFLDVKNPKTSVTGLSVGKNVFLWTVTNGVCPATADTITVNINDLAQALPTLITPNMDGRNDNFIVKRSDVQSKIELIIFDRRGVEVYRNSNYDNSWNGVDTNGNQLSDDTYFYVLRTGNSKSLNGYIVIRR